MPLSFRSTALVSASIATSGLTDGSVAEVPPAAGLADPVVMEDPVVAGDPDELAVQWVGQDELMRQLLAAWMVVNDQDLPMNPRLLGKPGVGKTTLAYAAAKRLGREVYIMQATVDTRPEDLLVTPVIEGQSRL